MEAMSKEAATTANARVRKHPMADSSWLEFPLETHDFVVDPRDDYRCLTCKRPRALHASPVEHFTDTPPTKAERHGWHNKV